MPAKSPHHLNFCTKKSQRKITLGFYYITKIHIFNLHQDTRNDYL
nr:MAG TPA: hypothetical protein [Caudoviricetes sp.]